jgi:hypothetical protein
MTATLGELDSRQPWPSMVPTLKPQWSRGASAAETSFTFSGRTTLAAHEPKVGARIGDRRQTEDALDQGRRLLDSIPRPENLNHHFVVDPSEFDLYAMDCYRMFAEDGAGSKPR